MTADETIAAALRGEPAVLSDPLVDFAERNGMDALLARTPAAASAPPAVASRLTALAAANEAFSAAQDRELTRVLAHLAAGGVSPILIKGAHLAHTVYRSSATRPRGDTDVLIGVDELDRVAALLDEAGYHRLEHVRGTLILGQCNFQTTDDLGVPHGLDVHWRLAAPLVFRDVLPVAAMRRSRVPVPGLGPHAWGPGAPHALIIACVHLIAHHRVEPIQIWLHDIARIVEALDERAATAFVETAGSARITAVCAAALEAARRLFDGPALAPLADRLRARGAGQVEPSAAVLTATRPIDDLWLDVRIADGWRERMTLVQEHLWPDAEYIRATQGGRWLSIGYLRRALAGARKWFTPAVADR